MKTATVHARIEPQTKDKAEEILKRLGLTPTEAIRIFYKQIALRDGLPFPVAIPNKLTASTLEKSRQGKDIQEFDSLEGRRGAVKTGKGDIAADIAKARLSRPGRRR